MDIEFECYDIDVDAMKSFKEFKCEPLQCWGRLGYKKPTLSEIWVPACVVGEPIVKKPPPVTTLDYQLPEPQFSIIPQEYDGCMPKSVKALLKQPSVPDSDGKVP